MRDDLRLTRRGVCALGAGLSLSAFAALGGPQAAAAAAAARSIRYVLTDQRYAPSLEFGATLAGHGAIRLEVTDGLTRLWSQMLAPLWEGGSQAVAGLTRLETWTCLAEQARSAGRRSILVGHHALAEGREAAAHSLTLTQATPGIVPALTRCGDAWPQAMAEFAAHYRVGGGRPAKVCHRPAAHAAAPVSRVLTSWIIA